MPAYGPKEKAPGFPEALKILGFQSFCALARTEKAFEPFPETAGRRRLTNILLSHTTPLTSGQRRHYCLDP